MMKTIHKKLGGYVFVLGLILLTSACSNQQKDKIDRAIDNACYTSTTVRGWVEDIDECYKMVKKVGKYCLKKVEPIVHEIEVDVACADAFMGEFCRQVRDPNYLSYCLDFWKDVGKEIYDTVSPNIPSNCSPEKNALDAAISSGSTPSAIDAGQGVIGAGQDVISAAQAVADCVAAGSVIPDSSNGCDGAGLPCTSTPSSEAGTQQLLNELNRSLNPK